MDIFVWMFLAGVLPGFFAGRRAHRVPKGMQIHTVVGLWVFLGLGGAAIEVVFSLSWLSGLMGGLLIGSILGAGYEADREWAQKHGR